MQVSTWILYQTYVNLIMINTDSSFELDAHDALNPGFTTWTSRVCIRCGSMRNRLLLVLQSEYCKMHRNEVEPFKFLDNTTHGDRDLVELVPRLSCFPAALNNVAVINQTQRY